MKPVVEVYFATMHDVFVNVKDFFKVQYNAALVEVDGSIVV